MEQLKTRESSLFVEDGSRERLRYKFLKQVGLETEVLIPLPPDASRRRYYRLPQALLMDAPPPYESTRQFDRIARLLHDAGLSVPKIYAADHTYGFLLLEDFGSTSYRHVLKAGGDETLLYEQVMRALAHLHQYSFPKKTAKDIPTYTVDTFLEKACLFLEWYPASFSPAAKEEFKELWREAYTENSSPPQTLVLRDVMIDNLFWLPQRSDFQRCGFIDFQDACWASPAYDLASVLEDVRREPLSPEFVHSMLNLYSKSFPDLDQEALWASFCFWGAKRTTRILGVFHRLAKRDERPLYLAYLPRLWQILGKNLEHPSLHKLRTWFHTHGDLR